MYASGLNSEDRFSYSLLFCHACLSSNRNLTMVGDYIDIYLKICDNVRMNVTSQVSLCWECITMLKKIYAFKKKVENAQKILDYCVKNQASLPGLTYLSQSETETTTFPLDEDEPEEYEDLERTNIRQLEDGKDELMIRIEDVRGHYEVEKPDLSVNSSFGCDVTVNVESLSPVHDEDELDHRRWKRTVLMVCKSICSHRYAHHFQRPVSDELAPLYSRVIRRPTDLGTIRKQINQGVIRTTPQLERALLLMFSNALMYNSTHHDMFHMALELRAETLRELAVLSEPESPAGRSRRRARAPAPHPAPARGPQPQPQPARRRRASLWTEPQRDLHETYTQPLKDSNDRLAPPAAKVRRRRHTEKQPAAPPSAPPAHAQAPPPRRAWDWTPLHLDTELLEPRHFSKKCKAVLL